MRRMGMAQESRYLSTRDEVEQVFRLFRDQVSEIKLRFNGVTTPYTARVLDLENDKVMLQNIVPRDGASHLRDGTEFSISGRADGLFVYITGNRATGVERAADAGIFRIPLPTTVLYQQRRRSKRVRVPVGANLHRSHVRLGNIRPIYARILDISDNGARIELQPARADTLRSNQRIENCKIHIPNQVSVDVDIMIRHVKYDPATQTMVCGLELLNPRDTVVATLRDFVAKITSNPL